MPDTSRRTAPSLVTRTNPECLTTPSGMRRIGWARTGKPPSSAWLLTTSVPSDSTGRLNLTSSTRAAPSGSTFHPTTLVPSTPRISPGPSIRHRTPLSLPWRTRSVIWADWRSRPAPTRTSDFSELVKKRAPSAASRVGFQDSETDPLAGRNPSHAFWTAVGTIGESGLNVTSAPRPSS